MRKILSLVLALVLAISGFPVVMADAATSGAQLQEWKVVQGDLRATDALTREMALTYYIRLLGEEAAALAYAEPTTFTDVPATHWAAKYISYAEAKGYTNGIGGGKFGLAMNATTQQMVMFMLRGLGYKDIAYADAFTKATEMKLITDTTLAAGTALNRGNGFEILISVLDLPKKDGTVALKVVLGLVAAPVAPSTVLVSSATALNNKVVEVKLTAAATAVAATQFAVSTGTTNVAIASAALAPYDSTGKTVILKLTDALTVGTLYTVKTGEKSANFGGLAADATKPTVSAVAAQDYNEILVTFNEGIDGAITLTAAEKYGTKAALEIVSITQTAKDKFKVITAAQKAATLYSVEISAAKDFGGNEMVKDTAMSFVGIAKPTAKQTVKEAKVVDSLTVELYFNLKSEKVSAETIANYVVTEKYGAKTAIAVTKAELIAKTTTKDEHVKMTLASDTKAATLYNIAVTNVKSLYDTVLDADQSTTFVGVAKDTTKLGTPTITVNSNTEIAVDFGETPADDVDTTTLKEAFTITEKYGAKAALAITAISIEDEIVTLTTAAQKSATLYEITVLKGIKDAKGNATTDDIVVTFVGKALETKITSFTATLDSTGTSLTVVFNKNIDATQAVDISHFTIDNSVGYPTKATYASASPAQVVLTVPKTTDGKIYKLTVKDLKNSDGVAMDAAGISGTFVGKGLSATKAKIEAVIAADNQTLLIYFDRVVTDATIKGQIYTGNAIIDGALTVTNADALAGAYDLEDAAEYAYQHATDTNVLVVRVATDNAFKTLLAGQSVMTLTGLASKVSNTAAVAFAPNATEPANPAIVAVQAVNVQTLRVYFSERIEDISVAANFDPANAFVYTDADGTTKLKTSGAVDINVSAINKIDDTTYDFILSGSTLGSTNVVGSTAYLYIATTEAKNIVIADDASVQDRTQKIEIAATDSGDTYASLQFGLSTTAITPDSITDINLVMTDERTMVVYFPEAMNATHVEDITNYNIVQNTTGTVNGTANVAYALYDSTDKSATLYLTSAIDAVAADIYLAIDGAVANESGLKTIKDEQAAIETLGAGLVRQFAQNTASPTKPTVLSGVVSDDRFALTVKFSHEVEVQGATESVFVDAFDGLSAAEMVAALKMTATFEGETSGAIDATEITSVAPKAAGDFDEVVITFNKKLAASTSGSITTEAATGSITTRAAAAADVTSSATSVNFGVPISLFTDAVAPVFLPLQSFGTDSDNDGKLNKVTFAFNENIAFGTTPVDLAAAKALFTTLTVHNGTADVDLKDDIAAVGDVVINGNKLEVTLDDTTMGTGIITPDFVAGIVKDTAATPTAIGNEAPTAIADTVAPVLLTAEQTAAATATIHVSELVYHVALAWSTDWDGTVNAALTAQSAGASAGVLVGAAAPTILITGLAPVNITTETVNYNFNAVGAAKIFDVAGNAVTGDPAVLTDVNGF